MDYGFLKKLFIIHSKETEKHKELKTNRIFHLLLSLQKFPTAEAGPGSIPEQGMQSRSPEQMAGAQGCELLPAVASPSASTSVGVQN